MNWFDQQNLQKFINLNADIERNFQCNKLSERLIFSLLNLLTRGFVKRLFLFVGNICRIKLLAFCTIKLTF